MHRIGADLFEFNGKQFLVMMDHYSSYPWVRRLCNISSASCIDTMKSVFSEFGYPQHLHSNSGRQYSSQELNSFVHKFNVKHMLKKCDNIYDALHVYRSTPSCNSRHSPYKLLFNCRLKDNVISLTHSESGPQKPLQRNSEPAMQKPICEILPPQPEEFTSDSSVVEEQALTGPDVINIPELHVLCRSSRRNRRKPRRYT